MRIIILVTLSWLRIKEKMQATIDLHYLSSSESSHRIRSAKLKHHQISFLVAGSKNNILHSLLDKINGPNMFWARLEKKEGFPKLQKKNNKSNK